MAIAPPRSTTETDEPLLTIEDLAGRDLPDWWELVEGRFVELSPTGERSSRLGLRFSRWLAEHGEDRGLGWAYGADAGFVLFGDRRTLRAPDAAFVRIERHPDPTGTAFAEVVPDLVVEVLSPSDRLSEALSKMAMYLKAGVRLGWLVHPERQTVTVFTPKAPPVTLVAGDILDGGDVLPELRVSVGDIFAP